MRFTINITGDYENVKGLRIAQEYYINIECTSCKTPHSKLIFISKDHARKMKIKEHPKEEESFNIIVECRNCRGIMGINVFEPEEQFKFVKDDEEMYLYPVSNDKCHISTIVSDSAVVTNVDGLYLDVVSDKDEIFKNCSFNKRILAEDNYKGSTVDILNFQIEVVQV